MGLSVRVGEFPHGAELDDGEDTAERDRRFAEMAERQARFMWR
jgi:hypothetical protein